MKPQALTKVCLVSLLVFGLIHLLFSGVISSSAMTFGDDQFLAFFFSYIINIVGQLIGSQPLQEQCCVILSTLLKAFKAKPTKDVYNVLGEELQVVIFFRFLF